MRAAMRCICLAKALRSTYQLIYGDIIELYVETTIPLVLYCSCALVPVIKL